MSSLLIKIIEHNTAEYHESVALRQKILRDPLGLKFSEEELKKENEQIHIAAWADEKLIGILLLVPLSKKKVKMRQVAVDEAMRGKGVGTRLVSFAEEYCIKIGYCRIELHARLEAVKFYENLAYTKEGDEFREMGIPHFFMVKDWCAS